MKNDIIVFLAKYLIFIPALIGLGYWLRQKKSLKIQLAGSIIIAAIIAAIAVKIAGRLYYHPRPFVIKHLQPIVAHGADNGFPSEHATFAMLVSTVLYFYRRRLGAICFVITILIGLGRIWARVHSPLDILAGLVIGAIAGWLGFWLAGRYIKAKQTDK